MPVSPALEAFSAKQNGPRGIMIVCRRIVNFWKRTKRGICV